LGKCTSTTLLSNVKNFGIIVKVKCKTFSNPKFFSTGFQMFSKNVSINVSVHAACAKMKISHSSHHHAATMSDRWTKTFCPRRFPGYSPNIITSLWSRYIIFVVISKYNCFPEFRTLLSMVSANSIQTFRFLRNEGLFSGHSTMNTIFPQFSSNSLRINSFM